VDDLLECAAGHLRKGAKLRTLNVPAGDGETIAWLHANGEVVGRRTEGMETRFDVRMTDAAWAKFEGRQRERA
jgi:GTP-binding protein HflX